MKSHDVLELTSCCFVDRQSFEADREMKIKVAIFGGSGYGGYGYGDRSRVAEMQRRLAQAGYYHGSIDGIVGPRTRRAMRAYQRDHGTGAYGMMDRQLLRPVSTG